MAKRKTTTVLEENKGPTQVQLGQLITGALNIQGNSITSTLFEHSEELKLSKDDMITINTLIKSCTERSIDATLDQLLMHY